MPANQKKSAFIAAETGNATALFAFTTPAKITLPCSLDTFFPFCRLAWGYCQEHIVKFSSDSPRFTPQFVTLQLEKVNEAETLPNLEARRAAATTALHQLMVDAQAVKMLCQKLKTYIEYAFTPSAMLTEAALKGAGIWHYSEVGNKWREISAMIIGAKNYMTANTAILMEKDNMPEGFPASFTTAGNAFNLSWANFPIKEKLILDGTAVLERDIREILSELNPMLSTGKRIFISDPVQRRKFTASHLRSEVQGHLPGGVGGTIRDAVTNMRMAGVTISAVVDSEPRSVMTEEDGKFKLQLPAGVYEIGLKPKVLNLSSLLADK